MDDYDDYGGRGGRGARKRLRETLLVLQGPERERGHQERKLPCTGACPEGALRHSW